MKNAFVTMLTMQDRMNHKVHPEWIEQHYEWFRAIWIECGELIDHYGYKWWKKQQPDMEQVVLEVVDIWHFGLSARFEEGLTLDQVAEKMCAELEGYQPSGLGVREATEALALHSLQSKGFSVALFWDLMTAVELDFEGLYRRYVGKNVLNFFRQDHGYKEGTYLKEWQGREDNEHLIEILAELESGSEQFSDQLYQQLSERYQAAQAAV